MRPDDAGVTVSIVVPVYNGGEAFRSCLEGLAALNPGPLEVLVVADGESDGAWRYAERYGARVIRLETNGGAARARNCGAGQARGSVVFFVDADVVLHRDAVGRVMERFRRSPELAALIGSYDDRPAAPGFISQYRNLLHHFTHQTARDDASTFWGACGAIRLEVFQAVGGFDGRYKGCSIEDIELGYRLKAAGHSIALDKALQCTHLKRWTVASMLYTDFFLRALPWTELILRERRLLNDLNTDTSSRLSVMAAGGLGLSLLLMPMWPVSLGLAGGSSLMLLALNWPLYRFFYKTRGGWFALKALPWHWFYYLYSGVAFFIGLIRRWLEARRASGLTGRVSEHAARLMDMLPGKPGTKEA